MTVQKILTTNPIWIEVNNYAQLVIVERFMGNYERVDPNRKFSVYVSYTIEKSFFGFRQKRITSLHPGADAVVIPFESFRWLINDESSLSLLYNDLRR